MRIQRPKAGVDEGDMTPMIDIVFQLIAFFMVLVNFTDAEQDERVKLPSSELARPPDGLMEVPLTLQLTKSGTVIFAGEEVPVEAMDHYLLREAQIIEAQGNTVAEATVIVRAHEEAQTGKVQELIKKCQENRFEKFALRAKQEEESG